MTMQEPSYSSALQATKDADTVRGYPPWNMIVVYVRCSWHRYRSASRAYIGSMLGWRYFHLRKWYTSRGRHWRQGNSTCHTGTDTSTFILLDFQHDERLMMMIQKARSPYPSHGHQHISSAVQMMVKHWQEPFSYNPQHMEDEDQHLLTDNRNKCTCRRRTDIFCRSRESQSVF